MPRVVFPYGKDFLAVDIPDARFAGELKSAMHDYDAKATQEEIVRAAIENPVGTSRLCEMAKGKNNIVIIASDHTRPVPSKVIAPLMLEEIRRGNPDAQITFLISTGCHRAMTEEELNEKFGEAIVKSERIFIHDCDDEEMLIDLGTLPSGGRLIVNKTAIEADLLIAEGFIEPHFFAGFSGGRKSVLPGIASRKTVLANHCAAFIENPCARNGILENNPIHIDMLHAARVARLDFIVNVVINAEKEAVYAVAGDCDLAHRQGVDFLCKQCKVQRIPSEIVITTNGGYPLDQNIYQAVKGMSTAEATVKEGGVIIMLAKSNDGHGGEAFYHTFREEKDLKKMMNRFLNTPAEETIIDQWQSQIFARLLMKARVIYISDAPDDMVKELHMIPAYSIEEAIEKADALLGHQSGKILAIPDGVSVIVL